MYYALFQKVINVIAKYNEGLIDSDEALKKIIYDVTEFLASLNNIQTPYD